MKNKFAAILLSASMLASFSANAQDAKQGDDFSARKAEMVADLGKEKAIVDSAISCINSAAKTEDIKKCHEQKRASMDSLRQAREAAQQQRMGERKQKLQKELQEIDNKMNKKQPSSSQNQ